MTDFSFNLDLYLSRISAVDKITSLQPNKETLALLQLSHLLTIPFENLDVVQKKAISIDLTDIYEKLVTNKRGGYCFEMNTLLSAALVEIGFKVKPVLARVRWNRPKEVKTAYTHIILLVTANDGITYMVDVGFGGLQCTIPLNIALEEPEHCPDGKFRIIPSDDDYLKLQWSLRGEWVDMYIFKTEEALHCDQLVANWWMSTSHDSRWVSCLFVARIILDPITNQLERHHILNNEYVIRHIDGKATRISFTSINHLIETLYSVFGLSLPHDSDLSKIDYFYQKGAAATFHSPLYIST